MPSKRLLWSMATGLCCAVMWGFGTWHYSHDAIPGRIIQVAVLVFFIFGGLYYFAVNLGGHDEDA